MIDRYGVAMVTRAEVVPVADFTRLLRAQYTIHPRFPAMAVSRVEWETPREYAGQFYRVQYLYEGFIQALPEPTFDFEGAVSEEPIETHPKFEELAGTPSDPQNGAIFIDPETGLVSTEDTKGVFREFGTGPKAGVQSYVAPGAIWAMTFYTVSRVSALGDLGEIDSPIGDPPTLSGRNWLLWAFGYRRRGFIYENRLMWRMSGRRGWDPDIY